MAKYMNIMEIENFKTIYEFTGKLGYLNVYIIPVLEKIFAKNPNTTINLVTYPDYAKLIILLFPDNVKILKKDSCITIKYVSLINLIDQYFTHTYKSNKIIYPAYLSKSLKYVSKNTKIICVFPQNESTCKINKNIEYGVWKIIVEHLAKYYVDHKVIILGHSSDKYLFNIPNVIDCCDILESINYLNKCTLFISSESGYINFAKNCNTQKILIVTKTEIEKHHFTYNPFDTMISKIYTSQIIDIESIIDGLIRDNQKTYYYDGELGFFMVLILPYIDKMIREDINFTLKIKTFPDFCNLLKHIYGNKVTVLEIEYTEKRLGVTTIVEKPKTQFIRRYNSTSIPYIINSSKSFVQKILKENHIYNI